MELNKVYCMENLELLRQLPNESIDLIYCDIDYDDKLVTPQEAIEWYRPRLIEMERVLKNTGTIVLQCDYRLASYLRIEIEKKKVKVKVYFKKEGVPIGDTWYFDFSQGKERVGYDTQNPKSLLERIIKMNSNYGDVVADFFCGSGTSMVVAKELGRQYIGCDINPKAVEIANDRLNKIITNNRILFKLGGDYE